MKLKRLLLVAIFVIVVSLFAFPATSYANSHVQDLRLTAVCNYDPGTARWWIVTNPNNFTVRYSYQIKYESDLPLAWSSYRDIGANSSFYLVFDAQDGHPHFIESLDLRWMDEGISGVWVNPDPPVPTTDDNCVGTPNEPVEPVEPVWVRTMPMTVWQVWINENNDFQFIFWYLYKDNNWVRIYDMEDNMVYETDLPINDPNLIVDLPDGFYMVRTYHGEEMLQEFLIGKP